MIIGSLSNNNDPNFEPDRSIDNDKPKTPNFDGIRERCLFSSSNENSQKEDFTRKLTGSAEAPSSNGKIIEKHDDELDEFVEEVGLEDYELLIDCFENEETADQKEEIGKSEEETGQIEDVLSNQEKEKELQIGAEGVQVDQEAQIDLHEGELKTGEGTEKNDQINQEILHVNSKISHQDEKLIFDNELLKENSNRADRNATFLEEHSKSNTNHTCSIEKINLFKTSDFGFDTASIKNNDHDERIKNKIIKSTEHLNKRFSAEIINNQLLKEGIQQTLRRESFANIVDGNGVPINQDEAGIDQLIKDIQADQQDRPQEKLSEIIEQRITEWIESKNLYEKDLQGNLIPITPKKQIELATILSRGIVLEIVHQIVLSEKMSEKNKTEEDSYDHLNGVAREDQQSILYQIRGDKLNVESFDAMNRCFKRMNKNGSTKIIKNAKSLQESNEDIIAHSDRINEIAFSKKTIKERVIKDEIEHLDGKHVFINIDRVRLEKLKKIRKVTNCQKERVPSMKPSTDSLAGTIHV